MEKKRDQKNIEAQIADIFTRGVGTFVDPDGEFRKKLIAKANGEYKKDIIIKFGVDPTRPDIHLGHAACLRKLRQLQDLGCKVVFLIGDFTAQIGDPTGKSKLRPEVEQKNAESNMKTYLEQVDKILVVDRGGKKEIVDSERFSWMRNSDWFYTVSDLVFSQESEAWIDLTLPDKKTIRQKLGGVLRDAMLYENSRMQKTFLGKKQLNLITMRGLLWALKHVTFAQLIERDMFQARINGGEPLYMHELLYPVLQGIDSHVMGLVYGSCDLEVGGADQSFNMLMGRKVMEINKQAPQAVLAVDILVGFDGKEKMSKSLDNYVGITDMPDDMFGKIMSIPDSAIPSYFELCTFTAMTGVKEIEKKLVGGKINPRDIKMDLAQQIVEIYHGRMKAETARAAFIATFQNKELPENMREIKVAKGLLLVDVLIDGGIIGSKNEFRRLLLEGAIRKDGKEKLTDPAVKIEESIVLKIGKHRFVKFVVE